MYTRNAKLVRPALQQMSFGPNSKLVRPGLQNLDFVFSPVMDGQTKLTMGEIVNGDAGKVTIQGNNDKFIQGTSNSYADASGSGAGGQGGDDRAAKAMAEAKAKEANGGTSTSSSSSNADADAAAAFAAMNRRLLVVLI